MVSKPNYLDSLIVVCGAIGERGELYPSYTESIEISFGTLDHGIQFIYFFLMPYYKFGI